MKVSRNSKRLHRKARVRAHIFGTAEIPRVCVFRGSCSMYVQFIDDENGKTLIAGDFKKKLKDKPYNLESIKDFACDLAKEAKKAKIDRVVFDRGGYRYHGKVKALADGLRGSGLKF